ncbi:hypothetical protein M3Y94_01176000 [Aphelenchoides besseyi]|nr:hypothetical protein M3Y94_01176000 [Aphelenchoides besseyi]KAI6228198.1 hypothetical protein M3Y95_00597400 [Aphelenchoides besseyi]
MQEPNLLFIRPDIRYETAQPLDPKVVIPLINEYLLRISDIQNTCTAKLERAFGELECRLDRTETLLCLLEKRLERVELPILPTIESNVSLPMQIPTPSHSEMTNETKIDVSIGQQIEEKIEEAPLSVETNKTKVSEHPTYVKYFKMIRLGIPEAAVRQKMGAEGFDPNILSDPNALVDFVPTQNSEFSGSTSDEASDSD